MICVREVVETKISEKSDGDKKNTVLQLNYKLRHKIYKCFVKLNDALLKKK